MGGDRQGQRRLRILDGGHRPHYHGVRRCRSGSAVHSVSVHHREGWSDVQFPLGIISILFGGNSLPHHLLVQRAVQGSGVASSSLLPVVSDGVCQLGAGQLVRVDQQLLLQSSAGDCQRHRSDLRVHRETARPLCIITHIHIIYSIHAYSYKDNIMMFKTIYN